MVPSPLDSFSSPAALHPPSSSMEDVQPQSTRKRPRLDSACADREAMSDTPSPADDRSQHSSASAAAAAVVSPASASHRPASRVTINTRSADTDADADGDVDVNGDHSNKDGVGGNDDDDEVDVVAVADTQQQAISISSSSPTARSPEIEVAEPEDMDQDPSITASSWRPLRDALRERDRHHSQSEHTSAADVAESTPVLQLHEPISLVESFPKMRGHADPRESVQEIAAILEKGHPHDRTVFLAIRQWLAFCTAHIDRVSPEAVLEDRDFWEELPAVVEALMRRVLPLSMADGEISWQSIEDFIVDYAQLTLRLLDFDTAGLQMIAEDPDLSAPDSVARAYLPSLTWSLQLSNIPFYCAMAKLGPAEIANVVARASDRLDSAPVHALERISTYASWAFPLLPRMSHLAQTLVLALNVAYNLVESGNERRANGADPHLCETPVLLRTIRSSYTLFRAVDDQFQAHVSKKSAWVSADISESLLRFISGVYQTYAAQDQALLRRLTRDLGMQLPSDASPDECATIVYYGWRMSVLKRHIMDGRMELRVFGMETMQADLVTVWRHHIQNNPDPFQHPITQYLVQFLRDHRIVEYIVGVGSHPQLISRSGNIVGFLIVTSTYTDADTDTIWKTVTDSEDQRIVGEVLTMLTRTFPMHPSPSTALLYICSKVFELPLHRFDARMLEFCEQLFTYLREKHGDRHRAADQLDAASGATPVDSIPLRLCVRLIRESTRCNEFSHDHKATLQRFASVQLSSLLTLGLSDRDKAGVYEQCIQDIADKNEFATGSIQALNALLPSYDSQEIRKLTEEFALTTLLILEFVHFWETNNSDYSDSLSQNSLMSRVQLLSRIITKIPDTISSDLSDLLWTRILLPTNAPPQARSAMWDMLCRVTGQSGSQNPFIERCLHQYLPSVAPEQYTNEIVAFAEQAVSYEIRFDPPPTPVDHEIVSVPGMDRIWHLILTAPPDTIEGRATSFAIDVYLDHPLIRRAPASAAEATHLSLVDRCVEQIKSAATKLKSSQPGSNEPDVQAAGLRLSRSLLFLQRLLQGLRSRPQYSPPQAQSPEIAERIGPGDPVDISYQCFSMGSQSKVRTLRIGSLCTARELVDRLVSVTGFASFNAIHGGHMIDLLENPDATVQDLKIKGLLIIRKKDDGSESSGSGRRQSLTLVDTEVLRHFDDLYDLLTLEDRYAREIYDFLSVFPPQDRVRVLVRDVNRTEKDLFPMGQPYVLLYSVKTLATCLREESLESEPDTNFVSHSMRTLVAALTAPEMEIVSTDSMKLVFACHLVECLLVALSVKTRTSLAVPDSEALIKQLIRFMDLRPSAESSNSEEEDLLQKLTCNSFAVLIDGSVQEHSFWDLVKRHVPFDRLVYSLLLADGRQRVRQAIADKIKVVCGLSKTQKKAPSAGNGDANGSFSSEQPLTVDIIATIWDAFVKNMRRTVEHPEQSQEYFAVALAVFRSVAERSPHDVIFSQYVREWSETMLTRTTEEFVGREPVDHIVLGFARLLRSCLEIADQTNTRISATDLIENLFNSYLFPDLSDPSETEVITPHVPVMHEETREELYNILVLLAKHADNYGKIMDLMIDLIPSDYTHSTNWSADRTKVIRSPEGYAGLKNLSNTCYVNSLFTQLFMNVSFREFMLQVPVTDPDSSQRLLAETKKIFGNMQDTWRKFVDPEGAVCSIRTYDNEPIDVTVQMDVDEFYNLLFDRWEAQIQDPEDRKKFRAFYGGQLVQQIKSKECEHISERLEPFSAIQCDIKGKASLEESLQAYVEGEVMQGDNKYSCTSCGRHVDAVKRACLKELPDNLIFHLKRFDFDMITMMRSKINDEFQFPERIDMTPYSVEYLSNPDKPVEPDIFELVGVLVHSGTAESGHYYSYVRERPVAGGRKSWVEFNDADVTAFDPSKIAEQCFGGMHEPVYGNNMNQPRFGKVWNAYMLFYQRVSSMEAAQEIYRPSERGTPVQVQLPRDLGNHIAMENELFIRTYCLQDPYHASFVRYLLGLSRDQAIAEAPNASELQKSAVYVALDTLDQLISRSREMPELDRLLTEFGRAIHDTPDGAEHVLEWVADRDTGLRNLILKPLQQPVRAVSMKILLMALAKLQERAIDSDADEAESQEWLAKFSRGYREVASSMEKLWSILPTVSRSWDDYFEFLSRLTRFQVPVVDVLLEHGFLLRCLEILWLDREDSKKLKRQYALYYRNVERGRKYSHRNLMEFLASLLRHIDPMLPPTADDEPRTVRDGRYSLTETEDSYIRTLGSSNELVFLRRVLQHHANSSASRAIMEWFLQSEPEAGLLESIVKVLEEGLRVAPAVLCAPYLEATLTFCQQSPEEEPVVALVDHVAKGMESINHSGGKEHLAFFSHLLNCRNERLDKSEAWFVGLVTERVPDWAPTLLLYPDRNVRSLTVEMLKDLVFRKAAADDTPAEDDSENNVNNNDDDDESRAYYVHVARELAQMCVERLRKTYLEAPGQGVEAKIVDTINMVVNHVLESYYNEVDPDDAEFMRQAAAVSSAVDELSIEVPEEIPSDDWEDNSMLGSDSEVGMIGTP